MRSSIMAMMQAFGGGLDQPIDYWPPAACRAFQVNQSNIDFGPTITGEFSAAINDVCFPLRIFWNGRLSVGFLITVRQVAEKCWC